MQTIRIVAAFMLAACCGVFNARPSESADTPAAAILWKNPTDISHRDLLHGSGGLKGAPRGPFVFVKEDMDGTNPKFTVQDRDGIKWKVKLGVEARPEVAASRLLWAVGYFTEEYYFLPRLTVKNVPRLKRGRNLVGPDGSFYGVRLKREPDAEEKIDNWSWRKNPFIGTREFNGLRALMAVINNWDLKTINNAVVKKRGEKLPGAQEIYMISDLGSSFGTSNWIRPLDHAKGNLVSYNESDFIKKVTDDYVDLDIATRPAIINAVNLPLYMKYLKMGWIGKRIPRADARWMGQLLSGLSKRQIEDAFQAAGYGPHEIEGFTAVLLERIAELKNL